MIPTLPGVYEFRGCLHPISLHLPIRDYIEWTFAEVYLNEVSDLCAKILDDDGHYTAAKLGQFSGQWRPTLLT